MVTATTYTNAAPPTERFDYKATGSMVARSVTPYTDATDNKMPGSTRYEY